jgi:hypothetical protein
MIGLALVVSLAAQHPPPAREPWQTGTITMVRHITTDSGDIPCPLCPDAKPIPLVTASQEIEIETADTTYYAGMVVGDALPALPLRPPASVRFAIERSPKPHATVFIMLDADGREHLFALLRETRKPMKKPGA